MSDWNDVHKARGLRFVRDHILKHWEEWKANQAALAQRDEEPIAVNGDRVAPSWRMQLMRATNNGKRSSLLAVQLVLQNDGRWKDALGYDEFAEQLVKLRPPPWSRGEVGEWTDADSSMLVAWLGAEYQWEPSGEQMAGALSNVARQRPFHPVRNWLEGLEWNGSDLLGLWLREGLSASDDPEYLEFVSRAFLIGAVARVMEPGCKNDTVLILEGEQGRSKSTALLELFEPWSSDQPIVFGERDTYLALHGTWLLELAELDSWNKAEVTQSKAFFSQRRDRYRPPYAHRMVEVPRQTVFCATTNQFEYLKDATGNRRYWPVRCGFADLEWIREHKEALFAEAVRAYRAGAKWWADTDKERALVEDQQDTRIQEDPWETPLIRYLEKHASAHRWTTDELLYSALQLDPGHQQRAHQNRLAAIMRYLGYEKDRWSPAPGQERLRGYRRPGGKK